MSFSILFPTNQFTASQKSSEEIQILTLQPDFTLTQKLIYITNKGLPQQYPYLFKHLPEAHHKILTFVCSKASTQETQNQQIILNSFKRLVKEKSNLLTSSEKELIFQTCLECLNNFQSSCIDQIIVVMQLVLKSHHDRVKLLRKLQATALELGKPNQLSISKVTAGRLITILASFTGKALKNELVDILKRVFTDNEVEARKIGISELFPRLIKILDIEFVELHFQQRIFEAVWGEDEVISVLALEVILKNSSRFGQIEQSSRIVKLFVDSLTSKSQKLSIQATSLMGQTYQHLQHVILKSQIYCIRFWKSLVELSQSKNEIILNNMVYNLPGILTLAAPYHKVEALCDIYIDLFYNPNTQKMVLASYFHEIVRLFPSKWTDLKELFYWMLNQLLQDILHSQEAIKITNKIIMKMGKIQSIFLTEDASAEGRFSKRHTKCFQSAFCNYLVRYLDILIKHKKSAWIITLTSAIKDICSNFSSQFIESTLLPKLYTCLRAKVSGVDSFIQIITLLLSQQSNPILINTYISKVSTEMIKSSRSFQRDIAITFFHQLTFYFSIDLLQEYRLGQKYLSFSCDKNYKIKTFFIQNLPRMIYFFNKEQKMQFSIILGRIKKDNNYDIQEMINNINIQEDQLIKKSIIDKSKLFRDVQKQKLSLVDRRKHSDSFMRRPITLKQIRKEEILRKRVDSTKTKTKVVIKDVPKRKIIPLMLKTNSNININKHI